MKSAPPLLLAAFIYGSIPTAWSATLTARVTDADSGATLPARVYLIDGDGNNHFVTTTSSLGSALPYREQWVPMANSKEQHTTVSAHPFSANVPAGTYRLEVYRGKEYLPHRQEIEVRAPLQHLDVRLKRWINLAERGWFSGETHVHRRHFELPNVMLAEDLNIAFPVTYWTTEAEEAPHLRPSTLRRPPSPFGDRQNLGTAPIPITPTHVVVPRNTEYEIFSLKGRRHTLGAVFIINHKTAFTQRMPPVKPIADLAHAEGALLDLDKHSWPWSLMLPPVAKVDLFELSNNSVWRTRFGFTRAGAPAPYMNIPLENGHMDERGWLDYGFQCYYAMLNCGLRMTPTAGTASGVHPVPLGFSRVYVHLNEPFSADAWLAGLKSGRSFVTTGPMLFATANGHQPNTDEPQILDQPGMVHIDLEIQSAHPLTRIELVSNGDVIARLDPENQSTTSGAYFTRVQTPHQIDHSQWVIARCFTRLPEGRERFAHTAPFYFELAGSQIQPKQVEIDYLTQRMRDEIERNRTVLSIEALEEFQQALSFYENLETR